jgi:arylsulfatase A-like enzyme
MNRYNTRPLAIESVALALALSLSLPLSGCSTKPAFDNVLLISIDTLSRQSLRAFNPQAVQLPSLDHLASESIRFANAHSAASWTLPAHVSLFTGLYPDRHGTTHKDNQLLPGIPTLALAMQEAGFETVAFTDQGYVHRKFGLGKGFDRYDDWVADDNSGASSRGLVVPRDGKPHDTRGQDMFDRGIAYLNSREPGDSKPGDRGFFLFLHTYAVHDYYRAHSWTADLVPQASGRDLDYLSECVADVNRCTEDDWDLLESLYQAELLYLDEWLGQLMAVMRERQLLESTLIIFVSDHGEGFDLARGRINHAGRLHEDLVRVPIMIRGPGIEAREERSFMSLVDIMPTVLDLCSLTAPENIDGVTIAGRLMNEPESPSSASRTLYAMEHTYWWDKGKLQTASTPRQRAMSLAVISADHWYIARRAAEELYDMKTDPRQTNNVAPTTTDLSAYRKTAGERFTFQTVGARRAFDAEMDQQLRALGYLE